MSERSISTMTMQVIGTIQTPFDDGSKIPIRSAGNNSQGCVTIYGRYEAGLHDLEGFDRIWLLYAAAVPEATTMTVLPPQSDRIRGVFATKSLRRPNPIALSCVRLIRVDGCDLHVEGVDMLNGSKLLDVRPYVPDSDAFRSAWAGWMENVKPAEELWPMRQMARL